MKLKAILFSLMLFAAASFAQETDGYADVQPEGLPKTKITGGKIMQAKDMTKTYAITLKDYISKITNKIDN